MRHFLRSATVAIAMAAASTLTLSPAFSADISGAGATFPYPIYAKWADAYKKETGIGMNYQSIGSGGGIKQIKAKTVTFGASDMPLKKADLDAAGLMQFPAVMGGVVPIINLDGIASGAITLDGPTMAKIFKGDITAWNDDAIKALNPGVELPSDAIAVVHRSDGSGTTFIFSDYLSKVSPEWKDAIGANTALEWPVGIGAKGNEGVANNVAQTKGAIGYVEFAYAKQNNMTVTKLVNAEGKAVAPAAENFQAAAAGADWKNSEAFDVVLTNEPGAEAWPISGATFILVYKKPDDAAATGEVLKFFDWAFAKGDDMAAELAYVPLPDDLVSLVKTTWGEQITDADGKPIYSGM